MLQASKRAILKTDVLKMCFANWEKSRPTEEEIEVIPLLDVDNPLVIWKIGWPNNPN